MKPAPQLPAHGHPASPTTEELPLTFEQPLGPPPPMVPVLVPVTDSVDQKPGSAAPNSPPAGSSTGEPKKPSRGQPAAKPAASKTVKPSAHARHMAQNKAKQKTSLHVDILLTHDVKIETLRAITGYPKCRIVEEALRRGLPGAKRYFQKLLEG